MPLKIEETDQDAERLFEKARKVYLVTSGVESDRHVPHAASGLGKPLLVSLAIVIAWGKEKRSCPIKHRDPTVKCM